MQAISTCSESFYTQTQWGVFVCYALTFSFIYLNSPICSHADEATPTTVDIVTLL